MPKGGKVIPEEEKEFERILGVYRKNLFIGDTEIEFLFSLCQKRQEEIEKLKAEVKRLQGERDKTYFDMVKYINLNQKLEASLKRLREGIEAYIEKNAYVPLGFKNKVMRECDIELKKLLEEK